MMLGPSARFMYTGSFRTINKGEVMQHDQSVVGKWVEVELVDGKKWIGRLEEWDEEAVFISNGHEFGHPSHKGAECANDEVSKILETSKREFEVR